MAIQGGYQGKLLDVDLTNERVQRSVRRPGRAFFAQLAHWS